MNGGIPGVLFKNSAEGATCFLRRRMKIMNPIRNATRSAEPTTAPATVPALVFPLDAADAAFGEAVGGVVGSTEATLAGWAVTATTTVDEFWTMVVYNVTEEDNSELPEPD